MANAFAVEILSDTAVSPNLAAEQAESMCVYPFSWRLEDGGLLCSYRAGREKHSRDGVLLVQRSDDDGLTWSAPAVIYDGIRDPISSGQAESVHTGVLCTAPETAPGEIIAIFKVVEAKDPEAYIFSEKGRQLRQRLLIATSRDGGHTWGKPEPRVVDGGTRDTYYGSTPLILNNRRPLVLVEGTGLAKEQLVLATTMTEGKAFEPLRTCAHDVSGTICYGDGRATLLPSGRIVVLTWAFTTASEETLPVHRCVSDDNGRTWTLPVSTGMASQIAAPLALDDRQMIAVSNVRVPPEGIYLWFSHNAGESWNTEPPIMMWNARQERTMAIVTAPSQAADADQGKLWAALPGFTFGTPELIRLADDRFLLTYYATVRGIAHVRANSVARFRRVSEAVSLICRCFRHTIFEVANSSFLQAASLTKIDGNCENRATNQKYSKLPVKRKLAASADVFPVSELDPRRRLLAFLQ